jgi:hypothetical protein
VIALLNKIRENASNPRNFFSYISLIGGLAITDKFLAEIKNKILKDYTGNGDIVDIKTEPNKDLKIIGFKHNEIKIEVSKIIDKAKTYNFPEYWEDTVELLTSDEQVTVKDLAQGLEEWARLEAYFKLTMPQA